MDEPTSISHYPNGMIAAYRWERNRKPFGNEFHRLDGPAFIQLNKDGSVSVKQWFVNGKLHRGDGPAEVYYYLNGQVGLEAWWINGQQHRIDGPAEIQSGSNGEIARQEWFINGMNFRPDQPHLLAIDLVRRFGFVPQYEKTFLATFGLTEEDIDKVTKTACLIDGLR